MPVARRWGTCLRPAPPSTWDLVTPGPERPDLSPLACALLPHMALILYHFACPLLAFCLSSLP